MHLTDLVSTRLVENAAAVGTTDLTTDSVDCAGADGVRFIWSLGAITDGTPKAHAETSSDDGSTDTFADVADSEHADGADATDNDSELLIIDVVNPPERYVRSVLIRGGSTGAVVNSCVAEVYKHRQVPVTQHSSVADTVKLVSPANGTK